MRPCPSTLPCTVLHCPPGHLSTAPLLFLGLHGNSSPPPPGCLLTLLKTIKPEGHQTHPVSPSSLPALVPNFIAAVEERSPNAAPHLVTGPQSSPVSVCDPQTPFMKAAYLLWSRVLSSQCEQEDVTPDSSLYADMVKWGNAGSQLKRVQDVLHLDTCTSLTVLSAQIFTESSACPPRHWQEVQKTLKTRMLAEHSPVDEMRVIKSSCSESQHRKFTTYSKGYIPEFICRCFLGTQSPYCLVVVGLTDKLIKSHSPDDLLNSGSKTVNSIGK